MTSTQLIEGGLALQCRFDGVVLEVLWDDFGFKEQLKPPANFFTLFDTASVKKSLAFVLQVKEYGVAFDWDIDVLVDDCPISLCFSSAQIDGCLLILACTHRERHQKIYEGLNHVINKQIDSLRDFSRNHSRQTADDASASMVPDYGRTDMINDMLILNNRLVNAERELARKNAELKRLSHTLSKDLYLAHRILHASGEAVIVSDRDRKVVDVNSAYTAITGYTKQDVLGQSLRFNEYSEDAHIANDEIWDGVRSQGVWQGECMGRRKNGERFSKWLSISAVPDDNGDITHYVVNFSDISRLKYAEAQWQKLAFYDSLTNLPNRTMYKDRLKQAIAQASREGESLVLLFIDLDDFKVVNDSLGHEAGDELLCETAQRLSGCTREADSIYRLGGDEFTVIVHACHHELDIKQLCDKIIHVLSAPFSIQDKTVKIGASIGIARYPTDGREPDVLTKNADAAMYAAKANGRNTSCFFSKALGDRVDHYLTLRTQITQGLELREFIVYLQPEIEMATGRIVSMEALVRWQHPSRGLLMPDEFIPIAEQSGLIVDLGEFVLCEALDMVKQLRDSEWPDMRVAVNVSGRQMSQPLFTEKVINHLAERGLPGQALIIEITESMVLGNLDHAVKVLDQLKRHQIDIAIDDFGTGYSSLSHLRRLPVTFVKIDKSFVSDADEAHESQVIIRAILAMAKSLGIKVVAEGVERSAQDAMLQTMLCEFGQGYWYSRPVPYQQLLDYLNLKRPLPEMAVCGELIT